MEKNIIRVHHPAVIITGLMAFILSLLWYSPLLFGKIWMSYAILPALHSWNGKVQQA